MSLLDCALRYAKEGWYIFPISPGSKKPFKGSQGLLDATRDEEQIRAWWRDHPKANIGMNCGMSGLVVLDVDTKKGKVGGHSLLDIIKGDFDLLHTRKALSWSGGSHYFYSGTCDSSVGKLGKDLDIRGEGGYIVLAPSEIHEDGQVGQYTWSKNDPENPKKCLSIAPFPEIFRPKPPPPGASLPGSPVRDIVRILNGSRNAELTRRAGLYRRIGMSPSSIEAALQMDNQEMCDVPLGRQEIADIAKSVGRYTPNPGSKERQSEKVIPLPKGGEIMSDDDFLARSDVEIAWQIEGFVQKSGLILLSSLPKVGKSDLARNMAKAISLGETFLGRRTKRGKVLWIGLAEPESTLRAAIETMGLFGMGISWVTTPPQGPWQQWLADAIEKTKADFVVVDEIGRLASDLESINDYSQVVRATQPFLSLRAKYGSTFCLLHHNNKMGGTAGSTAWEGAVDCIMSLSRTQDNVRTIQTKQRIGDDLEPTVLTRDQNTGHITAPMTKALADQRKAENRILEALKSGAEKTRQELANISSDGAHVGRSAVDSLVQAGLLQPIGTGRKGEPRTYSLVNGQMDNEIPRVLRPPEENPRYPIKPEVPEVPEVPEEFFENVDNGEGERFMFDEPEEIEMGVGW